MTSGKKVGGSKTKTKFQEFGMVWYRGMGLGWVLTLVIEIDYWRWTFNLYIDVEKLSVGGVPQIEVILKSRTIGQKMAP